MGSCSSKATTIHTVNPNYKKNKFQTSRERFGSNDALDNDQEPFHVIKTPRQMVLPENRRFDVNYTAIPNKIHKKPSAWDNQVFGLVGLKNLGNTCFMNSALQCLLNTTPLTDYFLSDLHKQEINTENFLGSQGVVTHAFANLVKEVWENKQPGAISPDQFYSAFTKFAPQFSNGTQEDSHDFLAILLDVIHEDLNRVKLRPIINESDPQGKTLQDQAANAWMNHLLRNRSIIVDLFQSQIKSSLKCNECGFVSYKFEPYMYLSLQIPEETKKEVTLYQCLDEFIKEEKLDKEERWHCPKCKGPKDSSKKIEIWNLPNILIIHLKRFKFTRDKRGKIRSIVDFPVVDLDLSKYPEQPQKSKPIYDLFAVSCHEGTLTGGHYTSYIKNRDTNSWYFFNDSYVKELDETKAKVVDSSGYVLFYSKTSVDVFQRQTISDPAAWPHFQHSRKGSLSEKIRSEHSVTEKTPSLKKKKTIKLPIKPFSRKETGGIYEPADNHSGRTPRATFNYQRNLTKEFEHNLQIHNVDLGSIPDLGRSIDNLETPEGLSISKKKSKPKQAVLILPKTNVTTIEANGLDTRVVMPPRYKIQQKPGRGEILHSPEEDMHKDYESNFQEKPTFGSTQKLKLKSLRTDPKSSGYKAYD